MCPSFLANVESDKCVLPQQLPPCEMISHPCHRWEIKTLWSHISYFSHIISNWESWSWKPGSPRKCCLIQKAYTSHIHSCTYSWNILREVTKYMTHYKQLENIRWKVTETMPSFVKHMIQWKFQLKCCVIKCFDNQVWHVIQLHGGVHYLQLGASYKACERMWSFHMSKHWQGEWSKGGSGSSNKK